MAAVNQTTGEVLHSDPSAEVRRGNPTTTDESLRMVISHLSQLITMRLEDDNFLMWKYQIKKLYGVMVLKVSCLEQSKFHQRWSLMK